MLEVGRRGIAFKLLFMFNDRLSNSFDGTCIFILLAVLPDIYLQKDAVQRIVMHFLATILPGTLSFVMSIGKNQDLRTFAHFGYWYGFFSLISIYLCVDALFKAISQFVKQVTKPQNHNGRALECSLRRIPKIRFFFRNALFGYAVFVLRMPIIGLRAEILNPLFAVLVGGTAIIWSATSLLAFHRHFDEASKTGAKNMYKRKHSLSALKPVKVKH